MKKADMEQAIEELKSEIKINYELAKAEEKLAFQLKKDYCDGWRGEWYSKMHKAYELNLLRAESLYKKINDIL